MKITKNILLGILIFSALIQLAIGIWLLVDLEQAANAFNITFLDAPGFILLGKMVGKMLISFFIITLVSIFFVFKDNIAGYVLAVIGGINMFLGGISSYMQSGNVRIMLVDSLRGLIIVALCLVYLYMKKKNEDYNTDGRELERDSH